MSLKILFYFISFWSRGTNFNVSTTALTTKGNFRATHYSLKPFKRKIEEKKKEKEEDAL